jgi:hypothetical protein
MTRDAAAPAVVQLYQPAAAHRSALQARVEERHDAAIGRIAHRAGDGRR